MTARTFRPNLEALEGRCTPATLAFFPTQLGGHSAVALLIDVQYPPDPIAPETVAVARELPNGVLQEFPPAPIIPPDPVAPAVAIHDLLAPGPYRGWLEAAGVSSSVFLPLPTTGDGGGTIASSFETRTPPNQETQTSYNLQYLQLQDQMQADNRQFTAVSNILQTKHDTVRAVISNIR